MLVPVLVQMLVNWPFGADWATVSDLTPGGVTWTAEVTAVGTPLAILATAFFAVRQLREAEKSRYAALAADLTRRWDEPLMIASRKEQTKHTHPEDIRAVIVAIFQEAPTQEEFDDFYTLQALPNFIETIAAVEGTFGLSLEFIDQLWGSAIISSWKKWSLTADFVREQPNGENAFKNFERLAEQLQRRRAANGQRGGAPWPSGGSGMMSLLI